MSSHDAIALTRELLKFDTINPPGEERECARYAGGLLELWGFKVDYHEYEDKRTIVQLGTRAWTRDPFSGETDGDKLFGRGSSDMKAGIAAMLLAARTFKDKLNSTPGIVLVLTAAEEGGCIGSQHLAQTALLGRAGAMIVGEPTSNYPLVGHKGSLKFYARFKGVSAHGSMPELGVNAVYKAARAVLGLEAFDFKATRHPVMGGPSLNVGTFEGGQGVNLVPDEATIGVDIRTVAGMDHDALLSRMRELLKDAEIEVFSNMPAVWTEPQDEWVQRVYGVCAKHIGGTPEPRTATYNTDAGNLLRAYKDVPTVVLGPGEAQMAHQTDEYCSQERIRQSVAIYEELIRDWCRAGS
jgi:succinyl-diaminopimelate desuccinylase